MTIHGANRGKLFIRVIHLAVSGGFRLDVVSRDLSHLQLLEGVSEVEALSRLRRLFSLCGIAQERIHESGSKSHPCRIIGQDSA